MKSIKDISGLGERLLLGARHRYGGAQGKRAVEEQLRGLRSKADEGTIKRLSRTIRERYSPAEAEARVNLMRQGRARTLASKDLSDVTNLARNAEIAAAGLGAAGLGTAGYMAGSLNSPQAMPGAYSPQSMVPSVNPGVSVPSMRPY